MKREAERGMMTVEAVLSLVPFIMVILGIISFTDIYRVHNKIQHAMYQRWQTAQPVLPRIRSPC